MDRPHVNREARGKRPTFNPVPGIDQAMAMIMVLASEIAMLRDRIDAGERVAKVYGIDLAAGIEALELDEAALHAREERRQDFLDRLFYLSRKEAAEARLEETREGYENTIADIAVN
jgi:hypothetical protein